MELRDLLDPLGQRALDEFLRGTDLDDLAAQIIKEIQVEENHAVDSPKP